MDKCPICGYSEIPAGKPMTNEMSEYVLDSDSKPGDLKAKVVAVINSVEDYINVAENLAKGIKPHKLRRKDYVPKAPATVTTK